MVQLVYYERRGQRCRKLLAIDASLQDNVAATTATQSHWPSALRRLPLVSSARSCSPVKVHLHAYEGWAQPALCAHLVLEFCWWAPSRCLVREVSSGGRERRAKGRLVRDTKDGHFHLIARYRRKDRPDPSTRDLYLYLSSAVSEADFHLGYSLAGWLERGSRRTDQWEMTHYAMVKRKGY